MSNKIEILSITDNEDGSANIEVECDIETLKLFAGIGLLKVLEDSAKRTIEETEIGINTNE